MDFSDQGLIFGDFSDLPDEESDRIRNILRPRKAGDRVGVEFPFDETVIKKTDASAANTELNVHAQEFVPLTLPGKVSSAPAQPFDTRRGFLSHSTDTSGSGKSDAFGSATAGASGNVQSRDDMGEPSFGQDEEKLPSPDQRPSDWYSRYGKTYERRNKKKRPPGYYSSLDNENKDKENSAEEERGGPSFSSGSDEFSRVTPDREGYQTQEGEFSNIRASDSVTIDIEMDACPNETSCIEEGVSKMTIENSNCDQRTDCVSGNDAKMSVDCETVNSDSNNVTRDNSEVINNDMNQMVHATSSFDTKDNELMDCTENTSAMGKHEESVNQPSDNVDWFDGEKMPDTDNVPSQPVEAKAEVTECENQNAQERGADVDTKESSPAPEVLIPSKAAPKPATWASLFKNASPTQTAQGPVPYVSQANQGESAKNSVEKETAKEVETVSPEEDKTAKYIGNQLMEIHLSHRPASLQPRGLINHGNWCYVNATLQALLACPPFFNLLKSLSAIKERVQGPSSTPITESFLTFVNEFTFMKFPGMKNFGKRDRFQDISPGVPFEPLYVYKMLMKIKSTDAFKHGKQEDAEEFLSCVLNGIHEEMVAVINQAKGKTSPEKGKIPRFPLGAAAETNHYIESNGYVNENGSSEEDEEWEQVGPKKKSVVTRVADFAKSPVSDIFCGQIRSVLHQSGLRESATLEPFFTLPLDIQSEKISNVKDALDGFVSRESLQGYTCSKTKVEVEATRRIMLEVLPPVLILHLKCFIYDKDGGIQKVIKKIDYGIDLEVSKDLLSSNLKGKLSPNQRSYKLFAVIYHLGKHAAGGHYTADVYHNGINGWIHIDDNQVKAIPVGQVVKFVAPKVPYLLCYRRCDLLAA